MTEIEWNDKGCDIENSDGQTISELGEIKTLDGWYGECSVECPANNLPFVIKNTTKCNSILNAKPIAEYKCSNENDSEIVSDEKCKDGYEYKEKTSSSPSLCKKIETKKEIKKDKIPEKDKEAKKDKEPETEKEDKECTYDEKISKSLSKAIQTVIDNYIALLIGIGATLLFGGPLISFILNKIFGGAKKAATAVVDSTSKQ